MQTISEIKDQVVTDTPLLVFDCILADGTQEHWSTHAVKIGNTEYAARVIQHSAFDIQTASDQGVDGSPRISLTLGNADSHFSEIERATGWKGARLTVGFVFYDLRDQAPLTETTVIFQGICNPPDQIKESTFRLTATNRMNLQRLLLPNIRIQRRCPWQFPATADQRAEAVAGGANGKYSLFYRCGYSAGEPGGSGNLNAGAPYPCCAYTRSDCQERGMLARFGGLEFMPAAIAVRSYGKDWSTSAVAVNQARYNDFVPMVYGTAWYEPMVVFARNDGNLTRMEVLLGIGQMQGVLTVLVNDIEIPTGVNGANMTGTGWYNVQTLGTRDGVFDLNFTDAQGQPAGDPYGSMAYLSVVVPNRISTGNSLPTVKVLAQGLLVPVYAASGSYIADQFSSNPAWILLDLLRRSGWAASEIDIQSFAAAAAYCDQQIGSTDLNGNPISLPRFQCNFVLHSRRSAGDVIRGVRNAARLYLTYGPGGVLQLAVENTVALQQAREVEGSNATEALNGGWPVYEFGDGSNGFSGIRRLENGASSVTMRSRAIADTPNCMTVEFQDGLNGYQQDSYSLVNADDVNTSGQQVTRTLMALGLPNYDQAARILKFNLDKSVRGNTYAVFETSVRGFGIRPGDLITLTYLKEGFDRQPFRVLKISPATNYRTAAITAQIHDDAWYADSNGQTSGSGGVSATNTGIGTPRPLIGSLVDGNGQVQFGIEASPGDGAETDVSVSFQPPASVTAGGPGMPLIDLTAVLGSGGRLQGGQALYYAISALDSASREGPLSFIVQALIPADDASVTLSGFSFAPGSNAFHVYRGSTPAELLRIASAQPLAAYFTDTGLAPQLAGPPDPNFDHANFYWRMELQPELGAEVHSSNTVGNGTLQMTPNAYRGMTVRITRGTGAGQERAVVANDGTTITVSSPWVVVPDAASHFTVAEAGWHFGALAASSPVQFGVPDRGGEVVQITGRSANVNDVESAPELALVTRWQIGGTTGGDSDVPAVPTFGLSSMPNGGGIVLSGISFTDLTNTSTVSSATLTLHYWDELLGTPGTSLSAALRESDGNLTLGSPGTAAPGSILQIEGELLSVTAVDGGGTQYSVGRGAMGTAPAPHASQASVYHLLVKTVVVTVPENFFGSPYSGSWNYPIPLPDVRVAGAGLFVTNRVGNSPSTGIQFMNTANRGLRSLSGGQYSIQVDGCLALDQLAAPALVVETARSVRDVSAVLGTAADRDVQLQVNLNGQTYCALTIPANTTFSNNVDGSSLPPLPTSAQITLSILQVGATYPGSDLTVLIRL